MNITLDTPLAGKELAVKVENLARQCGYTTTTKNKLEKVNMTAFLKALIEAEGIKLDLIDHHKRNKKHSNSYKIKVQSNGNLVISSAYTSKMNLKPGDEFEITLGRKHIHLKQVDREDENSLMMSNFLDFITKDAIENPEKLIPYTEEMSKEIDILLADVEL
jgi:bifunctional DNA-binding transcriptional regulator/antitoxin component of YhaV-PrlF toxin-antitoxin module